MPRLPPVMITTLSVKVLLPKIRMNSTGKAAPASRPVQKLKRPIPGCARTESGYNTAARRARAHDRHTSAPSAPMPPFLPVTTSASASAAKIGKRLQQVAKCAIGSPGKVLPAATARFIARGRPCRPAPISTVEEIDCRNSCEQQQQRHSSRAYTISVGNGCIISPGQCWAGDAAVEQIVRDTKRVTDPAPAAPDPPGSP